MAKKLDNKDLERRKKLAIDFLDSEFYQKFFKPDLEEQIKNSDKLSVIDTTSETTILKDFHSKKNKVTVYRGLLNKIDEWANKQYKN